MVGPAFFACRTQPVRSPLPLVPRPLADLTSVSAEVHRVTEATALEGYLLAAVTQLIRQFGEHRATHEFQCLEDVGHDELIRRGKQCDQSVVTVRHRGHMLNERSGRRLTLPARGLVDDLSFRPDLGGLLNQRRPVLHRCITPIPRSGRRSRIRCLARRRRWCECCSSVYREASPARTLHTTVAPA